MTIAHVTVPLDGVTPVSGLMQMPVGARACFVFAHGAGAGMTHAFMATVAERLEKHGIATLRYQFPYMERGSKRPDAPRIAHAAVRAAVAEASRLAPSLPIVAGGRSFGGRMTSQAQATSPLPGVRALVFLGFPLHPAGKPSDERARHLFDIEVPMLFVQGSRDALASLALLQPLIGKLGSRATLLIVPGAGHAIPVHDEWTSALVAWIDKATAPS